METETRRAAPPSRYKTVRRKPTVASPAAIPQPQQVQPQLQHHKSVASAPKSPYVSQQKTLLQQAQRRGPQDHSSRFRKMLRLNTSSSQQKDEPAPVSYPSSAPPTSYSHSKKLQRSPQQSQPVPATATAATHDEQQAERDRAREKAREDAILALEGKKPSSRSRPKQIEEPVRSLPRPAPQEVGIYNKTDAGSLLEQVRPGHERYLAEVWPSLGLERQVRYFEPVTDVISTWDIGSPSYVKVSKSLWGSSNQKLETFPKTVEPSGEILMYYYVQADKKWSKRTVNLDNNTIRIIKKDKPYDKDYFQSINMEYFDVYTFVGNIPDRKLRCPTRYCFAVKSQHRQSLFGKNSVFVHYFAVESEAVFAEWFGLVRDMKSRLIAQKKGLAAWSTGSDNESMSSGRSPVPKSAPGSPDRGRRGPKPLISPEDLAQPPSQAVDMSRSKSLHRNKTTKQSSSTRNRSASAKAPASAGLVGSMTQEVFSPGGLLGADYEEKRRVALKQFKEERSAVKDGFVAGQQTLLGGHSPKEAAASGNSIHSGDGFCLVRRETAPARPSTGGQKPSGTLLSFNEDEVRAHIPHRDHTRRGRGHTVSGKQDGALIDFATSTRPSDDVQQFVPPVPPTPHGALGRHATVSKKHGPPAPAPEAFTGQGLLAGGHFSSAGTRGGHGVKTGASAVGPNGEIRPLMDVGQRSVFAPGSLLERRERELGPTRPLIDRDGSDSDD
ncbi:hypothetical protein EDC01DRAFT_753209 [Geopyxis carbonaria]|nr:hypothetical protein EDC01DRAFT_753209 [Geopyxis carbonaria]